MHINIDYLQRLVDMSNEEIIRLVSGLRPLWIVAKMSAIEDEEKYICGGQEVLRLECLDSSDGFCNITSILEGVFTTLKFYQCPHYADNAIKNLDFSALSSVACNPEH